MTSSLICKNFPEISFDPIDLDDDDGLAHVSHGSKRVLFLKFVLLLRQKYHQFKEIYFELDIFRIEIILPFYRFDLLKIIMMAVKIFLVYVDSTSFTTCNNNQHLAHFQHVTTIIFSNQLKILPLPFWLIFISFMCFTIRTFINKYLMQKELKVIPIMMFHKFSSNQTNNNFLTLSHIWA